MGADTTKHPRWILPVALALGALAPLAGTFMLGNALPSWNMASLPIHSTLEVAGAAFGLFLAAVILFSPGRVVTTRRFSVACALISMSVLDIFHSCVPANVAFVWLHSVAALAGGVFFAAAWFPERELPRAKVLSGAAAVLAGATLVGILSALHPDRVPALLADGAFTPLAKVLNFAGGGLTILGGFRFAVFYYRRQDMEDLAFLFLCLLFGSAGMVFQHSDIWHAGWWFWHILRFGGYLLPFWLAVFAYRQADEKKAKNQIQQALAIADGDFSALVTPRHEQDELGLALQSMTATLHETRQQNRKQDWLKTGLARLNDVARGDPDAETLAASVITEIATYLEAPIGAFYIADSEDQTTLSLAGSYAFSARKNLSNRFKLGEGLVGQAAREKQPILLKNIPEDYTRISSQLGECPPRFISVSPILHEARVKGVIEIGMLKELSATQLDYLTHATASLGMVIESVHARDVLARSLKTSQALAEELRAQQEELRTANEELEEQTQALRMSEEELKTQQEELQVTNEELEEKTEHLERQRRELVDAAEELQAKAAELARGSKYKSEFLANMSHELRTPLNSLLILSGSLAENNEGNLTDDQVEFARLIHGSGKDLLSLINEILDLSKVEAGQMDLRIEPVQTTRLAEEVTRGFKHMVEPKGLEFNVTIEADAPARIESDRKRIGQILKNLIANAVKFTANGGVSVTFGSGELHAKTCLTFSVKDTGTGIPVEKQQLIFEAFQQADGSTARKYGGTGLGLSISRELAHALGGEIRLESEEGEGSTFSVSLPLETTDESAAQPGPPASAPSRPAPAAETPTPAFGSVPDDRDNPRTGATTILVVEDDATFANVLLDECHAKGLKCLVAVSGEEGLYLAEKHRPDAIVLDLKLPGIDGWMVLDQLKSRMETRHIPVHTMSADEPAQNALGAGAIGFLKKPAEKEALQTAFARIEDVLQRKMKNLLVIEDDDKLRKAILQLVGGGDVLGDDAGTGEQALAKLKAKKYDCVILDLTLPDMNGFQLLETADAEDEIALPPVIVYTGRELTRDEEAALVKYSESIIIKGVRSRERLFDETSLFLHRMVEEMPETKREMIANLHDSDRMFKDKTVLIVDDDMRNLFALSNALSGKGIRAIKARDGEKALEALEAEPDIAMVLLDIMMPVMDGYETMKRVRAQKRFEQLPIIALTAKAMKDDRRKCIEAGANDYLSKPIEIDRLLSMMRIWMYR